MTVHFVAQAYQLQHVGHALPDFLLPGAHHTHGKCHVLVNCHFLNEAVVLEHHADGAAQIGNLPAANPLQGVAVDMNGAGGGLELSGNQLDNGGFTGTGGAGQKAEFSVFDLHGHASQGFVSLLVGFHHVVKLDHTQISPVIQAAVPSCPQCNRIVTH